MKKTYKCPVDIFFKDLEKTFLYRVDILKGRIQKGIIDSKTIIQAEREVIDTHIDKQWQKSTSHMFTSREELKQLDELASGVYLIYDKSNVLRYVGMSGNLKTRLYSHFKRFDVQAMLVYEIDYALVSLVEMYLISTLFPYDNCEGKILYQGLSINDKQDVCRTLLLQDSSLVLRPIKKHYV
jgi:hypothetical protein